MDEARRLEALAKPLTSDSTQDEASRSAAGRGLAYARLAEAEVDAMRGDTAGALGKTAGFAQEFAAQPGVVREGLTRRLRWLIQAERWDAVEAEAAGLMRQFPDAAAGVIGEVVTDLEADERGGAGVAVGAGGGGGGGAAGVAAGLARQLADWAAGRGLSGEQLVAYRLPVVRSLRRAGRAAEAVAYLRDSGLERDGADSAAVIYEKARVLLVLGDPASLSEAARLLNQVIGAMTEPYPELYWSAWIARLEVMAAQEGAGEPAIGRRVRQLRQRDPELGGRAFRERLEALEAGRGN